MSKRGVTPVIATSLLIGVVLALSTVVFFWFRGFTQESITKFGGESVQLICLNDVRFAASYSSVDGTLSISNTGNVPIYNFEIRLNSANGEYISKTMDQMVSNWPTNGLGQGVAKSFPIGAQVAGSSDIIIIPVLVGNTNNGEQKEFTCPEGQTGMKVIL